MGWGPLSSGPHPLDELYQLWDLDTPLSEKWMALSQSSPQPNSPIDLRKQVQQEEGLVGTCC